MIAFNEDTSLRPFNTFGIDVKAKYFYAVDSHEQLSELFQTDLFRNERRIFLGGGSNVLFTKDFDGVVIHNAIQGIAMHDETDGHITLRVSSGVNWHQFVRYCVDHVSQCVGKSSGKRSGSIEYAINYRKARDHQLSGKASASVCDCARNQGCN